MNKQQNYMDHKKMLRSLLREGLPQDNSSNWSIWLEKDNLEALFSLSLRACTDLLRIKPLAGRYRLKVLRNEGDINDNGSGAVGIFTPRRKYEIYAKRKDGAFFGDPEFREYDGVIILSTDHLIEWLGEQSSLHFRNKVVAAFMHELFHAWQEENHICIGNFSVESEARFFEFIVFNLLDPTLSKKRHIINDDLTKLYEDPEGSKERLIKSIFTGEPLYGKSVWEWEKRGNMPFNFRQLDTENKLMALHIMNDINLDKTLESILRRHGSLDLSEYLQLEAYKSKSGNSDVAYLIEQLSFGWE
jgi:hypothetical protein